MYWQNHNKVKVLKNYMIFNCILKSTQRRFPNPGETRLPMRTKRMSLPHQRSEVEVVQPVSQIWMTPIQRAKVRSSKGQICTSEWLKLFFLPMAGLELWNYGISFPYKACFIHQNIICRYEALLNFLLLTFLGNGKI